MMKELKWWFWSIVIIFSIKAIVQYQYQITPERSKTAIHALIGTDQYTIVEQSYNGLIFGSPGDVTYNLRLEDGTITSCRCTDGLFQPLICRKYE